MEESKDLKDGIIVGVVVTLLALIIITFSVSYYDKCDRLTQVEKDYRYLKDSHDSFRREYYKSNNEIRKTIGLDDGMHGWSAIW